MISIMSLRGYKKKYGIKKHHHRTIANMTIYNDFTLFRQCELGKGEKCQEVAEWTVKNRKITSGLFVWYRSRDQWGLPVMFLFKKKEKRGD